MDIGVSMDENLIERFKERLIFLKSDCWTMNLKPNAHGYIEMSIGNRKWLAHRLSYEIFFGVQIPRGKMVCHKCDVRSCVNPAHLFLGSAKDNFEDAVKKGRVRPISHKGDLKDSCKRGHKLTIENTRILRSGKRLCRECMRSRDRKYWNRNKLRQRGTY